jgi:hypothetical protein
VPAEPLLPDDPLLPVGPDIFISQLLLFVVTVFTVIFKIKVVPE